MLRSRLDGGIRNKAARGELRRGLPVGLVWGEEDGEVLLHPDEAVRGVISAIFARFAECGSARATWLWLQGQGLSFPLQSSRYPELVWVTPTYHAVHNVLTHPAYAGAYVYGRTRHERYVTPEGTIRTRARQLARSEWPVLIVGHHQGYVDWETYETNQARLAANTRPRPHEPGGAVREGTALLQGLARCGRCGRHLAVHYSGRSSSPGYHCSGRELVKGRGGYCLHVGGVQIDTAVTQAFLAALAPAGMAAALAAATEADDDRDAALAQWRLEVDRARYAAVKAERRYLAIDPDNRLVARGLEAAWEKALAALAAAEAELARRPKALTDEQQKTILALGADVGRVWSATTTTDRDRKELLRTLLEEVTIEVDKDKRQGELTLRWRGGAITELIIDVPRFNQTNIVRTDEDTVALVGRLAAHHPDATIAGILNRQGRLSARGLRFTAGIVQGLRHHWGIARYQAPTEQPDGELLAIAKAAQVLGVAPSTLHRWVNDGFVGAEQDTPGAPWRIRITDELRATFVDDAPPGWLAMLEATHALGVSRQTILQRVKRGELQAVHVRSGRRKGLRIQIPASDPTLFENTP